MKKVLIIGASGSLAKYVIEDLKAQSGVQLTLLARNKNRISAHTNGCNIVEADVLDYTKLKAAIEGQDIVYVNLAGNLEAMSENIVKAMKESAVSRIIAIASIGIYETQLKSVLIPYRKLADIIEKSGLNYTILRPDWFTNVNEIDYALTPKGKPETGSAISRKSIAAFIGTIINNPELHKNENLGISKPNQKTIKMDNYLEKGSPAPKENFTGNVSVNLNIGKEDNYNTIIATVTFEPKARTNWHSHTTGQILFIVEGTGYYQEKDKQIQLIQRGDVIKIPKNVLHWHGASHTNLMRHIAIVPELDKDKTEWLQPVTDEDYNNLNK